MLYSLKPSTEKSKELIIPLIRKNRWVQSESQHNNETSGEKTTETSAESESVDAQAVKELIEGESTRKCLHLFFFLYGRNGKLSFLSPFLSLTLMTFSIKKLCSLQVSEVMYFKSCLQNLESNSTSGKMTASQRETSTSASHC